MTSVTALVATPHLKGLRIDLRWTNPDADSFPLGVRLTGISIVRRERTFPLTPLDGDTVYPPGAAPGTPGPVISSFSDSGTVVHPLKALTAYYYTVFAWDSGGAYDAVEGARAACLATDDYGLSEKLYRLLPAVHQRADAPLGPAELAQLSPDVIASLDRLPPALRDRGQLFRFFNALAAPLDLARSLAEGLRQVQNADLARPEYLAPLAASVDWKLDLTLPVFKQRSEVNLAPHLYRSVGTITSLREIVTRYSGWYVQLAEFAQSIVRSNDPARLGIFSIAADGAGWRASDDASTLLGFGAPNDSAAGTVVPAPAQLIGAKPGPFALRTGMDFVVTADDRVPVVARFRPGDFVNIAAATATEVAAVLNRCLSELTASVAGPRLVLTSNTAGLDSSLQVGHGSASLVSLEAAPRGRLSLCSATTEASRLRLFYEERDPLAEVRMEAAERQVRGLPFLVGEIPGEVSRSQQLDTPVLTTTLGADLDPASVCTSLPVMEVPVRVPAGSFLRVSSGAHARTVFTGADVEQSSSPANVSVSPFTPEFAYPAGSMVKGSPNTRATRGDPTQPAPPDPQLTFVTTLSAPLAAGNAYASLGLASAPAPIHAGAFIRMVSGAQVRTVYAAAGLPASAGPVALAVEPFTAEFAYPTTSTLTGGPALGTVRYKTYSAGRWGPSVALDPARTVSQGEPAAAEMANGQIMLAWLENPATNRARMRFALGLQSVGSPAVIAGARSGPFGPLAGTELVLRGRWPDPAGFHFVASDFAQPDAPTVAEVVAALNNRLGGVVSAVARANGSIELRSGDSGDEARLWLDVAASSAAAGLGFTEANCLGAGDSGDAIRWSPADDVPGVLPGRLSDLSALRVGARFYLFWAAHDGVSWNVYSAVWTAAGMGGAWAAPVLVIGGAPGHREPAAAATANGDVWTFFAELSPTAAPDDVWTIRYRVFRAAISAWDPPPPGVLTAALLGARLSDREPAPSILANGRLRVYFSSDRGGGKHIWYADLNPTTNAVTGPVQVTAGPPSDSWPAPNPFEAAGSSLLYRSDRGIPTSLLSQRNIRTAESRVTLPPPARPIDVGPIYSLKLTDTGTLLKPSGSQAIRLDDSARIGRRREWDDLITYTPQKPFGDLPADPLQDDDLLTRNTVGLYLSPVIPQDPGSMRMIQRLRPVLRRFLPINVRAVVILAPRVDIESVYGSALYPAILESYRDVYPYSEIYTGLSETYAVNLPDWSQLISNTLGHVSADPNNLLTLRRRTWHPPLL